MSASHIEVPDDLESDSAAEQSESRMREALDRLSGDRFGGHRANGERTSHDRAHTERAPADRQPIERPNSDRLGTDRLGGGIRSPQPHASFSSAGPRRHRYVQDGEVPVVQVTSLRDRRRDATVPGVVASEPNSDHLRALLAQERTGRQRAEQLLERAQATLHGLETRLGHAEITQREAVEHARAHEATIARLQAENADLITRVQNALAKAEAAEQLNQDLLATQQDLEMKLQQLRYGRAAEADIELPELPDVPIESNIFASDIFDDDDFDDGSLAPEPPPLLVRTQRKPGRRPKAAASAPVPVPASVPTKLPKPVARVAPKRPEPELEPEPVKWWLTPSTTAKRKGRKTG